MATSINLPINQSGAQIAAAIDSGDANLQTQITNLANTVAALQVQVNNLAARVNTISNQAVWGGAYVGAVVHLRNKDGDCTSAIIYEDPTKRNDPETISVVYVDPDNPNWFSRRDVREELGLTNDFPFNAWHIPENLFVPSGPVNLRRMIA